MSPDPWTAFLDWLETVIVPNWTELITMLPLFLVIGVTGPLLSLIAAYWLWHRFKRRSGRVRVALPAAVAAPLDAAGRPLIPVNVPYDPRTALLYPPDRTYADGDGTALLVRCPVDGTTREAAIQVCTACGTRFILGAARTPAVVVRRGTPPRGGAAAA